MTEIDVLRNHVRDLEIALERQKNRAERANAAKTHCDNCGLTWLDDGLNPVGCPYCKETAQ